MELREAHRKFRMGSFENQKLSMRWKCPMGKVIRLARTSGAAICTLVFIYLILRAIAGLSHGYSWHDMDWDQNGTTSISELFMASDTGKREIIRDGRKCIEYFAYKDGLPMKVVCDRN